MIDKPDNGYVDSKHYAVILNAGIVHVLEDWNKIYESDDLLDALDFLKNYERGRRDKDLSVINQVR